MQQGHCQGTTSSLARVASPHPGYSNHRDRKGTRIYALIKLERKKIKGIRPRSSHGHSLPWQGLVRSQYLLPPALRAGGMAAPPSPAEQGRTVPHVVLLLVMFPPEKGAWETLEQRGPGQVPAERVEPARSINTCSHPRTRATHNLPHFPWTSYPCWLHPTQD